MRGTSGSAHYIHGAWRCAYRVAGAQHRETLKDEQGRALREPPRKKGHVPREVEVARRRFLASIDSGDHVPRQSDTIRDVVDEWWKDILPKLHGNTISNYQYWSNLVVRAFGDLPIQSLQAERVRQWRDDMLKNGIAKSSASAYMRMLNQILNWAVGRRKVAYNVAKLVTSPGADPVEYVTVSPEEIQGKLLPACLAVPGGRLHALAIWTGMRRGELAALRWQDVNLEKKLLVVARSAYYKKGAGMAFKGTKSNKGRLVPLTDTAVAILRLQLAEVELLRKREPWAENDLVFPDEHGEVTSFRDIRERWDAITQQAGLPHMRFHQTRHMANDSMRKAGIAEETRKKILGHAPGSKVNEQVYVHIDHDDLDNARELMEAWGG